MKQLIEKEIIIQKMRNNTDQFLIQYLQQMIDKQLYSFDDFVNTGRIMPLSLYTREFGMSNFNADCCNICRYVGGFKAQNLRDGSWMIDMNDGSEDDEQNTIYKSENLKDVEDFIWNNYLKNIH